MNLMNLLGINLNLGSTELLTILLIWVAAFMLIQTILIAVLIKRSKNQAVINNYYQDNSDSAEKTEQKVEAQPVEPAKEQVIEEQVIQKQVIQEQVIQRQVVEEQVVAKQSVEEQEVQRQAVEEQEVQRQTVEEQAVGTQTVDEQIVEGAVVERSVKEQPVEEEEIEEETDEEEILEEEEAIEEEEETEEDVASAVLEEVEEEPAPVVEYSLDDDDEEEEDEEDLDDDEDEEEEEAEEDAAIGEIEVGGKALRPKYAYPTRIRLISDKVKFFYTKLKNEFLSYGFKNRISKTKENFNFSRDNVARFVVRGKTLKLYIALDPNSLDNSYFHHKDMSAKKTYAEIPTMVRIKSGRGTKKAMELIAMLAENYGLKKKRRFQDKDFSEDLSADGLTYVERKGFGYLMKESIAIEDVQDMPEELAERFTQSSEGKQINRFVRTRVTVDELAGAFNDGEVVTIEAVRARGIGGRNANYLIVEDGNVLDKKLVVYADEIAQNAVMMVVLCGGEVFKIDRE